MGGQDGFSRDLLDYESTSNTLMVGLRYKPADSFRLDLDASWTAADASLEPFDLSAPDFVATHPSVSYDFSQTHTYSNLDMSRIEARVGAKLKFTEHAWMYLSYRYADFADDAPYLYDTSGTLQVLSGSVGWRF